MLVPCTSSIILYLVQVLTATGVSHIYNALVQERNTLFLNTRRVIVLSSNEKFRKKSGDYCDSFTDGNADIVEFITS